jgi:hypothetical protein
VGGMQRELTADLTRQSGLEVVSFRHFDCLLFSRGEILKMFIPSSHRLMMGTPKDRRVAGNLFVVFAEAVERLRPPSKRHDYSDAIFAAPIDNFPGLILHSALEDGIVDKRFLDGVASLLNALPNDRHGWETAFGSDYFSLPGINTMSKVVRYLREAVRFPEPPRPDFQFEVTIIDPPPQAES